MKRKRNNIGIRVICFGMGIFYFLSCNLPHQNKLTEKRSNSNDTANVINCLLDSLVKSPFFQKGNSYIDTVFLIADNMYFKDKFVNPKATVQLMTENDLCKYISYLDHSEQLSRAGGCKILKFSSMEIIDSGYRLSLELVSLRTNFDKSGAPIYTPDGRYKGRKPCSIIKNFDIFYVATKKNGRYIFTFDGKLSY